MLGRRIVKRDRPAAPEKTHLSALMRTAWMSRSGVFRRADAFGEMFYGGKSDSRLHFPCCIRMLEFVFSLALWRVEVAISAILRKKA